MTAQEVTRKRHGLFVLAIVLLLLGGATFALGSHNFALRTVGLACVGGSVYLVRASQVHEVDQRMRTETGKGPGRRMWMVGVVLLLMWGASYFFLYQDAQHGGHDVLPVYVFAGVGLACAVVWSYLLAKLVLGGGRRRSARDGAKGPERRRNE